MQSTKADIARPQHLSAMPGRKRHARLSFRRLEWRKTVSYFYLAVALPASSLLCFLVPPMQAPDEGRHFLRACQLAQGQIVSEIEPDTHAAGGWLPAAASDFVRDKMTPEYLRVEDRLHSVGDRLRALDRAAQIQAPLSLKKFAPFPGATIYPPALYLPQAAGVRLARLFSSKVYLWFYSARLLNAVAAVLLIFFSLRLAPAHQFALLIPAVLPISLYQISSVSSDAAIIALSILFVALCLRFVESGGALVRIALVACLLALTAGKPVHLPFALLLLAAHERLGWRRAILFCSTAAAIAGSAYLAWSYVVRQFLPLAGTGFPGHDPSVQVHFIAAHPAALLPVLLNTLKWDAHRLIIETIGFFGWGELPLPPWFYKAAYGLFAILLLVILLNYKRIRLSRFLLGSLTAVSIVAAIFLASFIMWTPVGGMQIWGLQGRYLVPVLAILPFCVPSFNQLGNVSRIALAVGALGFFVLSTFTTVRIVKHYFFPEATLLGGDIHELFTDTSGQSCPATLDQAGTHGVAWFSTIANGRADVARDFRIVVTDEHGTILAESDPALAGADFPYVLLPGSSHSRWRVRIWTPNEIATLHCWLVTGKNACMFRPDLKLKPYPIPET